MPQSRNQSIHRAIADLRRGGMVLIGGGGHDGGKPASGILVMAAEQVTKDRLADLRKSAGGWPVLLLTPRRAAAIGLGTGAEAGAASVHLPPHGTPADILSLIGDTPLTGDAASRNLTALAEKPESLAARALLLMRMARLLPAALAAGVNLPPGAGLGTWADSAGVLMAESDALPGFEADMASTLREAARARLPLADAENTEIAIFRPGDGGTEHLALIIHPDDTDGKGGGKITTPPLVRIHSQCITGDILGSLKCDCGDQLRGAIRRMAGEGGGIVIYLAQEGRDIGLVNKLRAYGLQDDGLDTVEANHALGFETDHRFFLPAAEMLRQLGHTEIRLMTNNPGKIKEITAAGISVAERVPLMGEVNPHNARYLETKKTRDGHLMD